MKKIQKSAAKMPAHRGNLTPSVGGHSLVSMPLRALYQGSRAMHFLMPESESLMR